MRLRYIIAGIACCMMVGGCNLQMGAATPPSNGGLLVIVTATLPPSPTSLPPTSTPNVTSTPVTLRVKLALIAVNDNGQTGKKIGCGDSVIMVDRDIMRTGAPLKDTLTLLFSLKQRDYGQSGLYNALYQSDLKVDGISSDNGVFRVDLSGKVAFGGACDSPRFEAQIRETIMQFATVKDANIFINGVSLEKVIAGA